MPTVRVAAGLFLTLLAAGPAFGQAPPADAPKGVRAFHAGHSFHMPLVQPLQQIAQAAGIADHRVVGVQGLGGSTVSQHWDLPDDKDKARKALAAGTVDVLTVSPHILAPDPAIDKYAALLLEHNPKGRIAVQASWLPNDRRVNQALGFRDDRRDETKPDDLRKAGAPWVEKLREQVKDINARYAEKYGRPVAVLVPVGEAVYRLRERVAEGEVPGIAKQSDLFNDGLGHGGTAVSVLTAYCHYAAIYGRNPTGLPAPASLKGAKLGENAEKVNRILQEVAWEATAAEAAASKRER